MNQSAGPALEAIRFTRHPPSLSVLNQLHLPHATSYTSIRTIEDGHRAINSMQVRGASAIGCVAALTLAVDLLHRSRSHSGDGRTGFDFDVADIERFMRHVHDQMGYLKTARPTAVNLFRALKDVAEAAEEAAASSFSSEAVVAAIADRAERMLHDDARDNMAIGRRGAEYLLSKCATGTERVAVLTHCNTGSLATAGYGTALGIVRSLHAMDRLAHAYFTETRPYNQGARLTAYELLADRIPSTLIADSMAAALISVRASNPSSGPPIAAIVVGADRVARNGDVANKIGTYQLAIVARHHRVSFVVAAPSTSIDLDIASGSDIVIEERPSEELVTVAGTAHPTSMSKSDSAHVATHVRVAPRNVTVWNPAFDITPAELVSAIVTERGVLVIEEGKPVDLAAFLAVEAAEGR